MQLTDSAQRLWAAFLRPGARVVDATAGNGRDALFIAQHILPSGQLHCVDIQAEALARTRAILELNATTTGAHFHHACHSNFATFLNPDLKGSLDFVCFNLGYLPNGNHAITTQTATTLRALHEACLWLNPTSGWLSVIAYRGHQGALAEFNAVQAFFDAPPLPLTAQSPVATGSAQRPGPVLFLAQRAPNA